MMVFVAMEDSVGVQRHLCLYMNFFPVSDEVKIMFGWMFCENSSDATMIYRLTK